VPAQHRATVAAGIDESIQLAIAVASDKDGLTAHVHGEVIILVWDLGLVGEIDPVSLPDVLHLKFEEVRIGKDVPRNTKTPCLGVVFHQRAELAFDLTDAANIVEHNGVS